MNEWIILSQSDWDKYFLILPMFLIAKEADLQMFLTCPDDGQWLYQGPAQYT